MVDVLLLILGCYFAVGLAAATVYVFQTQAEARTSTTFLLMFAWPIPLARSGRL